VCEALKKLQLPWAKLNSGGWVETDGAAGISGKRRVLMCSIMIPEFYKQFPCIIQQQSLCKIQNFEHIMKVICGVGCELHSISWL
jgi:hypothetical protein